MSFTSSRSSWLSSFRTCIHSWSTFSTCSRVSWSFRTSIHSWSTCFSITCRWLRICRLFCITSRRSFCMSFFTSSRVSWLSSFRTSVYSWSWRLSMSFFSCTSGRSCRSFCMSSFTSRWLLSCTCRWLIIYRSFCMSFRTSIHSRSTFITSCWVSWSYGGTFTFGCTSRRSFSMSFTSGWLFSMSFTSCWVIRLSFIMFRLLCFTVFICINDIFT